MVMQQIKMLFLSLIGLLRRALCCFSRRRKLSHSDQLQAVNVIVERSYTKATGSELARGERDWNSWDDSPRTVEEHIEQYRQRMANPPTPPKDEPEPDFFSDLAPVIKPQLKYYMEDDKVNDQTNFSRLEAKTDVPIAVNADLEDWEEEEQGGWEELDAEQTKQMIREKRRELRTNRQNTAKSSNAANKQEQQQQTATGIGATRLSTLHQQQQQQSQPARAINNNNYT